MLEKLDEHQKKIVDITRGMNDELLYDLYCKSLDTKYKSRELFYGRDVDVAFPKSEFRVIYLSEYKPDKLYYLNSFDYHTMTLEMGTVKIWNKEFN